MATHIQKTMAAEFAPVLSADKELVNLLREGAEHEEQSRLSWAKVWSRMQKDYADKMDTFPIPGTEAKPDGSIWLGLQMVAPVGTNLIPDKFVEKVLTADGPKDRPSSFYEELWDRTEDGVANRERHSGIDNDPAFADDKIRAAEKGRLNTWRLSNIKQIRRAVRFHLHATRIMEVCPKISVKLVTVTKDGKEVISAAPRNIKVYDDAPEVTVIGYSSFLKYDPDMAVREAKGLPDNVGLKELVATNKRGAGPGESGGTAINVKNTATFQKAVTATSQYLEDVFGTQSGRKTWEKALDDDATLLACRDLVNALTTYVKRPDLVKRINALDEAMSQADDAEREARLAANA